MAAEHRAASVRASRPKRYLVLGSVGHGRGVDAYVWDKVPPDLNVADYDAVVLNFAAFEEQPKLASGLPPDRLPDRAAMTRMLFAPGTDIVAIGNPSTSIGPSPSQSTGYRPHEESPVAADYWLPVWLEVEAGEGAAYDVVDAEWQPYFENVTGWSWFATGDYRPQGDPLAYLAPITRKATEMSVGLAPLAQTRFGKAIGLKIQFAGVRKYRYNPPESPVASSDGIAVGSDVEALSNPIYWLPAPSTITSAEAVDVILATRHAITEGAREPDWVAGYRLPAQTPIAEAIATLEAEKRSLEARIAEEHRSQSCVTSCAHSARVLTSPSGREPRTLSSTTATVLLRSRSRERATRSALATFARSSSGPATRVFDTAFPSSRS
jgi:hypothetical protein